MEATLTSTSTDQNHTAQKYWKPHPGPQTEAFRYYYVDELLYGGAKGGGKTDWLLFDFLVPELLEKPHYRGIIFRRTYPRLREVIDRSLQWFTQLRNAPHFNKSEKCWEFPSGAKLYFAHCQHEEDKYDYQGHEYHYMAFDQVEEFTQSQYEFLIIQSRTTDPEIKVRFRATANPGNIGHLWVKRRWVDNRQPMTVYINDLGLTSMYIPAKVYDNPAIIMNDPMYVKRLEALPENERKALLEGDWNIFAGQYFKEWDTRCHVVKPFYIPTHWKRFIAGDYGLKKPSSVGWYAVRPEGGVVRYREIYKEGYYYDTLAKEICRLSGEETISYAVFDPAIFGDKQHHKEAREGQSGAEIMQEEINKHYASLERRSFQVERGDNRRIEGWRNLKQMMTNSYIAIDGSEVRMFQVFETCVNFITVFPSNIHDTRNVEDLDTDGEDHSADEARYAAQSCPPETSDSYTKPVHTSSPKAFMERAKKLNGSW